MPNMRTAAALVGLTIILSCCGCQAQTSVPSNTEGDPMAHDFAVFVDNYFHSLFEWSPTYGTSVGLHQYDSKIEDFSQPAIAHRIETLKAHQTQLGSLLGHLNKDDEI